MSPHTQTSRSWRGRLGTLRTQELSERSSIHEETEIDPDGCLVSRAGEGCILDPAAVGELSRPRGMGRAPSRGRSSDPEQEFERLLEELADLLARDADVPAIAFPLLPGRGLDLVTLLLGVAQEVPAAEIFERSVISVHAAAAVDPVIEALRDQLRIGRHDILDRARGVHGLRRLAGEVGRVVDALVEQPGHAGLDVRVERGVLHLVDLVERHERADLHVGELAVPEEFAQQLEQAADRMVISLGPADRVRSAS